MENYQENLRKAITSLKIADHMLYVTYPLVSEKRLLIKIFDEVYKAIIQCINAILNYESLYKRINLHEDNQENMEIFISRCAKNYFITNEQIKKIKEVIEINKRHKQSAIEFVKKEKIVIMSDNLSIETLDVQRVKQYLLLAKELLLRTTSKITGKN